MQAPPRKILVVDDEAAIRRNLRSCLEDYGYRVVEAGNGLEGQEVFAREQPDLVLSDLRMEKMDGLALVGDLHQRAPDIPVIVVSGAGQVRDAVAAIRGGAWDYITKPIHDAAELEVVIARCLERARLAAENRQYREHLEQLVAERTLRLHASEQRLRAAKEELEDIVQAASHDLRQPLVNLLGFGARLEAQCGQLAADLENVELPPAQRQAVAALLHEQIPRALGVVIDGGHCMARLIEGLLEVSRTGRRALQRETLDMAAILREVMQSHAELIREARATVSIADDLLPCTGDACQLRSLFAALLDNAVKYRDPERALNVGISSSQNADRVIYRVADNGQGIPANQQRDVWGLFRRLAPDGPIVGAGLGLTLAKRIVANHDGRIWLESQPGVGTTLLVELPAPATLA